MKALTYEEVITARAALWFQAEVMERTGEDSGPQRALCDRLQALQRSLACSSCFERAAVVTGLCRRCYKTPVRSLGFGA
jgi:hypothetical protein